MAQRSIVVVPTYNEAENITDLVSQVLEVVPSMHVLVVDDSSPDGTGQIVEQMSMRDPRVRLVRRPGKLGLGTAYVQGFKACLEHGYDIICQMDCDFSHQPKYLRDFMRESEEWDVVIGSRYVEGGKTVGWDLRRRLLSRCGNFYARVILGLPIRDLTGGFKCFRKQVLQAIDLDTIRAEGYGFQMEMNYRAYRLGFKIKEIPIEFPDRTRGQSKLSSGIFFESLALPWRLRFSTRGKRA